MIKEWCFVTGFQKLVFKELTELKEAIESIKETLSCGVPIQIQNPEGGIGGQGDSFRFQPIKDISRIAEVENWLNEDNNLSKLVIVWLLHNDSIIINIGFCSKVISGGREDLQ